MYKKILGVVIGLSLAISVCGCAALFVGAAAGGGTAVWLSGKLTQQVNAPLEQALKASKSALAALNLPVEKETVEREVAQVMSKYTDGKTIWIDIHRITDVSSKIEVRVGAIRGDKVAADRIMKKITNFLR